MSHSLLNIVLVQDWSDRSDAAVRAEPVLSSTEATQATTARGFKVAHLIPGGRRNHP